jgi:toxin ParE1/3/4
MSRRYDIEITAAAERDLLEISRLLRERASPRVAEDFLDRVLDAVATLERLPERGAIPAELADLGIRDFRQLIVETYRLIYRVFGAKVVVMLVADGRQDMQRILERRLLEH